MTSSEGSGISQKGCTPEYWKKLGSKPDFKVSELWSHGRLPNCACKRKWTRASAAMLATKMSAGVAPDVIIRNPWHNNWQSLHFHLWADVNRSPKQDYQWPKKGMRRYPWGIQQLVYIHTPTATLGGGGILDYSKLTSKSWPTFRFRGPGGVFFTTQE